MHFELDHVFVAGSTGAPEAAELQRAGFDEGPPNTHPGQGTACRRFFFERSYLELIWLVDLAEASSAAIVATGLALRAQASEPASHVGICLRRARGSQQPIPIETWSYRPPYLPDGMSIPMAANSSMLDGPLVFFVPHGSRPQHPTGRHANGARDITTVSLTLPKPPRISSTLEWLAGSGLVDIEFGDGEALSVELDGGAQGKSTKLTTSVPVHLNW